ncbi:GSCFA domain-containing protein, partial [Bacteroidota bacterium]
MQKFRTEVDISPHTEKLDYNHYSFLIGSCFTQNIGSILMECGFNTLVNPYGVLYNPYSIYKSFEFILGNHHFHKDDLIYHNEQWLSLHHHTSFSDDTKEACLKKINNATTTAHEFLNKSRFIVITFGTSWIYEWKETGEIVSNCHKIPAVKFNRRRLSTHEIIKLYDKLLNRLNQNFPDIQFIFTISPVRHWKDGAIENQISKSILFVSVHELLERFENCSYFPAYEIVMDDLRDYRFYNEDMLHPNS